MFLAQKLSYFIIKCLGFSSVSSGMSVVNFSEEQRVGISKAFYKGQFSHDTVFTDLTITIHCISLNKDFVQQSISKPITANSIMTITFFFFLFVCITYLSGTKLSPRKRIQEVTSGLVYTRKMDLPPELCLSRGST